ncbi:MAG: Alpha-glucosidase [Chloroflexi bacterium OLB13]|nr:MAG: Alpha-glucosidase [Chloroflexi bacterium OLB13]
MRPIPVSQGQLDSVDKNHLVLTGGRGEALRITPLADDVVRVQFMPDGAPRSTRTWTVVNRDGSMPREGRNRDAPCAFAPAPFTWIDNALFSARLRVQVNPETFALSWSVAGKQIFRDLPDRAYTYDCAGQSVWHYLEMNPNERYYGFGERTGRLEKSGRRLRLKMVDALGYDAETSDPLYKHIPFHIILNTQYNVAFGIFHDNAHSGEYDNGAEIDAFWGSYRSVRFDGGDLDYYVIYGPTMAEVLDKYTRLTGRPAEMPGWALGYLGSAMKYTEAEDADAQLRRFLIDCEKHEIPVSGFHLSSGYTTDALGRRRTFCWNTDKIPDPAGLAAEFNKRGVRLAANVKPYILESHPKFASLRRSGALIKELESERPQIAMAWPGGRNEKAPCAYIDFTSEAGYNWWVEQATETLLKFGISALWNDNNEFQLPDDAARCAGFGETLALGEIRPVQTLLMAHASYTATAQHDPSQPPLVLTRAGSAGIQRYAQTWTGDNRTSWHTLKFNIPMGLGLSLSGVPNWGHDVGGFDGPPPSPELLVRWAQAGALTPRFTIHSWNTDGSVTSPWMYLDVLPLVRDAIRLRMRFMPYLKQRMLAASVRGEPINAPTVFYHSDDPNTYDQSFEFMVGPDVLVAPVYEAGADHRTVYLPAGRRWVDWHTGDSYVGGRTTTVPAPLERLPLFVAEGGILLTSV